MLLVMLYILAVKMSSSWTVQPASTNTARSRALRLIRIWALIKRAHSSPAIARDLCPGLVCALQHGKLP